ncbi:MAG: hypothetical protein EOM19_01535 [Candidatus Moranbacteria bacterium]|nr:hypothetical protein [Candidatus Moranbacteria bacterium]
MKIKKNNFLFFYLSFFIVCVFSIQSVLAQSVDSIAEQLERRYHLNLKSIQNQGEYFNVSDQKKLSPEVLLFFSPADPHPGQEITTKAFPLYFENKKEDLYYTWYLKKNGCDLGRVGTKIPLSCDKNGDNEVTVEDWKIEASLIIANTTIEKKDIDYTLPDNDKDGYIATYGGDGKENIPDRCYIMDQKTGIQHELAKGSVSSNSSSQQQTTSNCPIGYELKCTQENLITCRDSGSSSWTNVCASDPKSPPSCLQNKFSCNIGLKPLCLPLYYSPPGYNVDCGEDWTCDQVAQKPDTLSCGSGGGGEESENGCKHLFPNAPSFTTGDNKFLLEEERFWGTNPQDPDTSNTGYGDESNIVGRGIMNFSWNYQVGDKVGVAVEGTSQIPTKHDEHSKMIMWALPKNNCPVTGKGSYTKSIKGYNVEIPTATMDLNTCLEKNLVDPREGDQKENIKIQLSYSPEDPLNDSSGKNYGEPLMIYSSLGDSTEDATQTIYTWDVFISSDGSYDPRGYTREGGDTETASWVNITELLTDNKLIGQTKGNDIPKLDIKLNLTDGLLKQEGLSIDKVFPEEAGHLRIKLSVREQFSYDTFREGTSTLIVKINNSNEKIQPAIAEIEGDPTTFKMGSQFICNDETTLRRGVCYVAKNEVISLVLEEENIDNYSWELDGKSLVCNKDISTSQCENEKQTKYNFFPITGKPGFRHIVKVSAIESLTGKATTYSRVFEVVEPFIEIISTDTDNVWPKYLGYYKDTDGTIYEDISMEILQGYALRTAELKALFFPSFIGSSPNTTKQWVENIPFSEKNLKENTITFPILDPPGNTYLLGMEALYKQDPAIRETMKRIWGLTIEDSKDLWLQKSIQVEVVSDEEIDEFVINTPQAFFASLSKNMPSYLWLTLQTFLSIITSLFIFGLLYSLANSKNLK